MDKETQELLEKSRCLLNEVRWKRVAASRIPLAKQILSELKSVNDNFESALTPEKLESCREQLLSFMNWFRKEEKEYTDAPWLLSSGAENMVIKIHNRYNELLYKLAQKYYGKSIIGFIDEEASNFQTTKEYIEQEIAFDDEEVRDLRKALYIGE